MPRTSNDNRTSSDDRTSNDDRTSSDDRSSNGDRTSSDNSFDTVSLSSDSNSSLEVPESTFRFKTLINNFLKKYIFCSTN